MRSPNTLIPVRTNGASPVISIFPAAHKTGAGFTLIEVLIAIAIVSALAVLGIIAGLDSYSRSNFNSQRETAIALLQKARSEAINNIGAQAHGVYFNDNDDWILFAGTSYIPPAYEYKIEKNKAFSYTNTCAGNQVVFTQLSGRTTGCTITITGAASTIITVNDEGAIDY